MENSRLSSTFTLFYIENSEESFWKVRINSVTLNNSLSFELSFWNSSLTSRCSQHGMRTPKDSLGFAVLGLFVNHSNKQTDVEIILSKGKLLTMGMLSSLRDLRVIRSLKRSDTAIAHLRPGSAKA